MKLVRNFLLPTVFCLALLQGHSRAQEKRQVFFDIRTEATETSQAAFKTLRKANASKAKPTATVRATMAAAQEKLAATIPGLTVEKNPVTQAPEVVELSAAAPAGTALSAAAKVAPEAALRGFVTTNAAFFGLTKTQAGKLETVASYANPAGNLSWVELKQSLNGIPVFQGTIRAAIRKDGAIARTTGNLAGGLSEASLATEPKISAAQAVVAAAATVGVVLDPAAVVEGSPAGSGQKQKLTAPPFVKEVEVSRVYFPLEPGTATLAYAMVLWEKATAWYALVDAQSGQLLWRKNITNDQTQTATYSVYDSDSPVPNSPTTATPGSGIQGTPAARTTFTLISELPAFNNLGWITDGGNTTSGNNADAGLDIDGVNGIDANGRATGTNRVFDFTYTPGGQTGGQAPTGAAYRNGVVTNLFFWSNRFHDRLYQYGFTEAAGNFQANNFGRGGAANDRVLAQAQDSGGTNNANFSTPPDGQSGVMQMYIFTQPNPDRDGDLDQEIVIHELAHGLSNRLHANGSGLTTAQAGGMGEGWSDFYARALLATADEDVNGVYASGAYATRDFFGLGTDNSYYGIRRFPYAVKTTVGPNGKPHNPMTFADIDPAKVFTADGAFARSPVFSDAALEVHSVGEIWCLALLEVRARIIARLGFAAGNDRVLQIVTDAMKLEAASPTLIQARNAIIAADNAGFAGEDVADIWAGFAVMGMGFNAAITNTAQLPGAVIESFITPNLVLGAVTFDDTAGNGDGFPDPGETLVLTVPIRNLLSTTATGVTVAVSGGTAISYGTIANGTTTTQSITYKVPSATPSGTRLKLPVAIDSSLGPAGPGAQTFELITGQPVNGFTENFDALAGTALPTGWTTTRTGAGSAWTASTTNADTAPKAAFSANVTTTGSAEMVTPSIPVTSATGQLTFRTAYNLEASGGSYFDGMVLEVSVNNGAFEDILEAGGEFLSGGYNSTLDFSSNPLGGRNAWSGLSGGTTSTPAHVVTRVLLPASANGKSVRFKWILACDGSVAATGTAPGARVDGVVVGNGTKIGQALNKPPVIDEQTFGVAYSRPVGFLIGNVAASDPDPGQTLTYSIESGNASGFFTLDSTTGALKIGAALSQQAAAYLLVVKVLDDGTVGGAQSDTANITVNVRAPGVTPLISAQNPVAVLEDGSVTIQLSDLVIDDPDSLPADFTLTVLDGNGTNFTRVGATISPAANLNGTITVPVQVTDGETDSAVFNLTVSVTSVNDVPAFAKGPDQAITADGLTRTVSGWATAIVTGPADEQAGGTNAQSPSFLVTTSNDAFFTTLPAVSAAGSLSFTGGAGVLGAVTVTVKVRDDGGTASGGVDTSGGQSFTITSTAVTNDPPSFIVGSDQSAAQDAGTQTVVDFATAIAAGPLDEAGQAVTFAVQADNPQIFTVLPAISPEGVLTYTPNPAANGTATVTVTLSDNGSTSQPGDDNLSDAQTFLIAVTTFAGHDGVYAGLALPALDTPLGAEKTGLLSIKATAKRTFTGKLTLGAATFSLRGTVDNAGVLHFGKNGEIATRLTPKGFDPVLLELRIDVVGTSEKINGSLKATTGDISSTVAGDRLFYSKAVPPPYKGSFTVVFDQPKSKTLLASALPQGDGFGLVTVSDKGVVKLAGTLADGTKVKYANGLSKADAWPVWIPFSKGTGTVAGQVIFRVVVALSDVDGPDLLWFKPEAIGAKKVLYPGGWPKGVTTTLIGSTYVPGSTVALSFDPTLVPAASNNASVVLTQGGLSTTLTRALKLEGKKVTSVIEKAVITSFTLKTGQFKGTFVHPVSQKKATFQGAVLQKQKLGTGYFNGDGFSTSGGAALTLTP